MNASIPAVQPDGAPILQSQTHHCVDLLNPAAPALETLALEINAEHDAAERHARKAVDHARAAGEHLLLAKAQVAA